nr:hypothetical protein [Pseudomonas sp. WS 5532]
MRPMLCDTVTPFNCRGHQVQIDLNNPENLTLEAVRQLLASASDDEHTQLRVTKGGIAFISSGKAVGGVDIDGLLFRLETWAKGSGYVGNVAASDEVWVRQIFNALEQNWPKPPFDYIDIY